MTRHPGSTRPQRQELETGAVAGPVDGPRRPIDSMRLTAPHFCAGLILSDGRVAQAAPILRYMLGWPAGKVQRYCLSRRWQVDRTPLANRPETPNGSVPTGRD